MQDRMELFPRDLETWLAGLPPTVKVLSLDCFDTLVWRKVAAPNDVFYALQDVPAWSSLGIRAYHRAQGELGARRAKLARTGSSEASIGEIYQHMLPSATPQQIDACAQAELQAELSACFVFKPLLRLVEQALKRGLRVVILSDTYWSAAQLRTLITGLHDDPVLARMEVFTSCEEGLGKSDGVWPAYLRKLHVKPDQVAHLGDNPVADVEGPARFGIRVARLVHHDPATERHVEDYLQASVQLMPDLRQQQPVPSQYRALLAERVEPQWSAEQQLGYRTLGPVFYAFSRFVQDQWQQLSSQSSAPVRMGFLMRDGHLPGLAYQTLTGDAAYCPLHISRLTANAASLYTADDIREMLGATLGKKSMEPALRQLMYRDDEIERLLRQTDGCQDQVQQIRQRVLQKEAVTETLARAAAVRQRLLTHIRQRTGLEPGETLVMVDLGYSGTVQNRIRFMLRKEMNVALHGIYLLALQPGPEDTDRSGLIGPAWADERMVTALIAYIGIFEMLCTKAEPSTVDYADDGEPVFGEGGVKSQQSRGVEEMQQACLAFVRDMLAADVRCLPNMDMTTLARQAAGELGRLIYLPSPAEVACLSGFEFDFNLGTDLMLQASDLDSGVREFRREGFSSLNKDFTNWRVNAPMELRYMDLSLANTLMCATRFGFDVRPASAGMRGLRMSLLIARAQQHALKPVETFTTIDGFHVLHLPCSASMDMSLLWGQTLAAVQLEAIERVPLGHRGAQEAQDASGQVVIDGVDAWSPSVLGLRPEAMIFVPRCAAEDQGRFMLRVVFRPLESRSSP